MAIRSVNRKYFIPLGQDRWTRNGVVPDYRGARYSAVSLNHSLAHLRKVVFCKSSNPGAAPQGVATQQVPWRWHCRTGSASTTAGQLILVAVAGVAPADNSSGGADPRWRMVVDDGSATNSDYRHYPIVVASPTMDDVVYQKVGVNVDPDTVYACHVELEERCRMFSLTVYEFHVPYVDTADTGTVCDDSEYSFEAEITDAQHSNHMVTTPHNQWKKNGSQLWTLVPETESGFWTTSSSSYVNMLDATASTTVSANTPGVNTQVRYYNPAHTDSVVCRVGMYGFMDAGGVAGELQLHDSNGSLGATTSVTGTTPQWSVQDVNLDGTIDSQKIDIQFRSVSGVNTFTVEAVSLYVYVA